MATNNALNKKSQELTIDPGASGDSFVQFDINSTGEFRIGVDDDDSDSFKISQGSALGTNDTFVMTASGERTMGLQPCFSTDLSSQVTNVTGDGTAYTVAFDNEIFDIGSNVSGSTFTAPVTGKYLLATSIRCNGLTASHDSAQLRITTSNKTYYGGYNSAAARDSSNQLSSALTAVVDMDASDTATIVVRWAGSTKVVDVDGNGSVAITHFTGALIC